MSSDSRRPTRPTVTRQISAKQQMRSAQSFTFFSCLAVLALPLVIPMFIWVAASIFMYAAAAHHPNPKVVHYVRQAGYRFYATFALLVVMGFFGFMLAEWMGRFHLILLVWAITMLLVIPLGLRDIWRAAKDDWKDITVEVEA
jgi:hypothetical protein